MDAHVGNSPTCPISETGAFNSMLMGNFKNNRIVCLVSFEVKFLIAETIL